MLVSSMTLVTLCSLLVICVYVLLGLCMRGSSSASQAAWRPRCNQASVVKLVDGTVLIVIGS